MKFEYLDGPKSEQRMMLLLKVIKKKLSVWGEEKITPIALKLELIFQRKTCPKTNTIGCVAQQLLPVLKETSRAVLYHCIGEDKPRPTLVNRVLLCELWAQQAFQNF